MYFGCVPNSAYTPQSGENIEKLIIGAAACPLPLEFNIGRKILIDAKWELSQNFFDKPKEPVVPGTTGSLFAIHLYQVHQNLTATEAQILQKGAHILHKSSDQTDLHALHIHQTVA